MRVIAVALIVAGALVVSGCATIVSDSEYRTTFNSAPSGATVTITNENGVDIHRGTTPFTTTLSVSNGYFNAMQYSARFEHDCYRPTELGLDTSIDGWYVGNIIFGGLIGILIVDPATGAMYKIDPNYSAALTPLDTTKCAEKQTSVVPYLYGLEQQSGS